MTPTKRLAAKIAEMSFRIVDGRGNINWCVACVDERDAVLKIIDEMFEELRKLPLGMYIVRRWPTVERGVKDFDSELVLARVHCRFNLLKANITEEQRLTG